MDQLCSGVVVSYPLPLHDKDQVDLLHKHDSPLKKEEEAHIVHIHTQGQRPKGSINTVWR